MSIPLTYPGVYVHEEPSSVRTITGVATSITAFVGRALRGPVDEPVTLTSYADFERTFGGLWLDSALGYEVGDFFRLGGGTAIVVRVHKASAADPEKDTATITVPGPTAADTLVLAARSPGAWGAGLTAAVDYDTADPADTKQFNLTVADTGSGVVEVFRNLSADPASPRWVTLTLARTSSLVEVVGTAPTVRPQATDATTPATVPTTADGKDGVAITADEITEATGLQDDKKGLYALEKADLFNLLVVPPYTATEDVDTSVRDKAIAYATGRRAVVLLDPPPDWTTRALAVAGATDPAYPSSPNAAVYFPRVVAPDPLRDGMSRTMPNSGAIAGVIAATDASRGVWKAPAGLDAVVTGVTELAVSLTDGDIGQLNPVGVDCLRATPGVGHVIWGARTRQGSDRLASQWKYLPVRRTALYLEESLFRALQWVVFEPNDEPLWAQIRLNVGSFLNGLFRQGAFAGTTPKAAYFVKCDRETTTQNDVDLGIVNIRVGFAPLKPAEFVVLRLQQIAGQLTV